MSDDLVKECSDIIAEALRANVDMVERQYGVGVTHRVVTLALLATVGRFASQVVERETALKWFTRALDNDPGFGFGDDD